MFHSKMNVAQLLQSKTRQAAANDRLEFFKIQQEGGTTKGPDFLNHNVRRFVLFQTRDKSNEAKSHTHYFKFLFFSLFHTQRLINRAIQCLWTRTTTPLLSSHNGFIEDVERSHLANMFFSFTRPTSVQNHKHTKQI